MNQRALLIAEKPSLMRDIQHVYNKHQSEIPYDITFISQVGHLVELLDPVELNPIYKQWNPEYLPIVPEEDGGWQYKVKEKTKQVYRDIESESKSGQYDVIIHAGDPDQEGELLVNLVLHKLNNKLPVIRFWNNSQAECDVLAALKHMEDDSLPKYQQLYGAALVRQHSDWRFGMNGSRAIAGRLYAGTSNKIAAGRVMTWVQSAIVHREDEIANFIPKTVYGVEVEYSNTLSGLLYIEPKKEDAKDNKSKSKKEEDSDEGIIYFDTEAEADSFIDSLGSNGIVKLVKKTQTKTYAPKLFNLAAIQGEASKFHITATDVLATIQSLYEKHYISYPRTDCSVLSTHENFPQMIDAASSIPGFASACTTAHRAISRVTGMKKYCNDAELQKHGHSALAPTSVKPDFAKLTADEKIIYKMICQRFLAIFQPPLIQDKTVVITEIDGSTFKSNGKTVVDKGYTDFLGVSVNDISIPEVNEGDSLNVNNFFITEKTSVCPKHFNDGTLIQAMENPVKYLNDKSLKDGLESFAIGTSATRDSIIEKLIKDKYIKRNSKGQLLPTEFGAFMIHSLEGISLCKADTTGEWEHILVKIKDGTMSVSEGEEYMKEQVNQLIHDVRTLDKASFAGASTRQTIMTCPGCGNDIIEAEKNFFCSGYKDGCKYSLMKKFMGATFTAKDVSELFNNGSVTKKLKKNDGTVWPQKLSFSPTDGKLVFEKSVDEDTDFICPACGEKLIRNGSKLKCSSCDFSLWTTIAKHELTNKELAPILENGKSKDKIKGLKKKDGTTFSTYLVLEINGANSKFNFKFK